MYRWGDLRLDPEACEVSYQGKILRLYPQEYKLLKLFFDCPNQVLSPSVIIERLWSCDSIPTESAVRTLIKGLRRKLKDAGAEDVIQTIHSLGYRLKRLPKEISQSNCSLSPMLIKLLALHSIEYLIVDINLMILEVSPGVRNFSDYPFDVAKNRDITLAFPELIGIESILIEIIEGSRKSFEIQGIAKGHNPLRPDYINIYAIADRQEECSNQQLLILFEDSSEKMILKQHFIQKENELNLLQVEHDNN